MEVCVAFPATKIKECLSVKTESPDLRAEHQCLERTLRQLLVVEFARQDGEAHSEECCPASGEHLTFDVPACKGSIVPVTAGKNDSVLDDEDTSVLVEMHDNGCEMWEKGKRAVVSVPHGCVRDDARTVYYGWKEGHLLEAFRWIAAFGSRFCQVSVSDAD